MTDITAVSIATDGKLLVAGTGPRGASIVRRQTDGGRDAAFGVAGRTWIDLDSRFASHSIVRNMTVREDGSVIAVGGMAESDQAIRSQVAGPCSRDQSGRHQLFARARRSAGSRCEGDHSGPGVQAATMAV